MAEAPQRIEVPGVGIVEFPAGMSDEQITRAIQSNRSQWLNAGAPTRTSPYRSGISEAAERWRELPLSNRVIAHLQNVGSGLPVVRNYPHLSGQYNPDLQDYQFSHPWESTGARIVGSTAPFGGVATAVPRVLGARAASNLGLLTALHGGTGAGLNIADRITQTNPYTWGDVGEAGAVGGLFGASGPYISRLLGPVTPEMRQARESLRRYHQTTGEAPPEILTRAITNQLPPPIPWTSRSLSRFANNETDFRRALGGAALGYGLSGGNPFHGLASAAAAAYGPHIARGANRVIQNEPGASRIGLRMFENQIFTNPWNRLILEALAHSGPSAGTRYGAGNTLTGQ